MNLYTAKTAFFCIAMATAASAQAAIHTIALTIQGGSLNINGAGGAILDIIGYADIPGVPKVPGPVLTVAEGDTVNVTITNNHGANHNFVVQGVTTDLTSIPPGSSHTYSFTAPASGTYLYGDTLNSAVNREMGLYGTLVVRPANGSLQVWNGGPTYDFDRLWVVSEMDKPRWNDVAAIGNTVNTSVYKPNYFLINGLGGFDGMMDMTTTVDGMVGETALVRIVNAGQFSHSLHFHGNHFQIVSLNGVPQNAPFQQRDTISMPPMSTAEVLYYLGQPGHYPMHAHIAQTETANGVYLNGVSTMIMMH